MGTKGIGRRLREARKACGLTLDQVAEAVGVGGHHVVSRWETEGQEHRDPDYEKLERLAKIYGVRMSYLLGETPESSASAIAPPLTAANASVTQSDLIDAVSQLQMGHARLDSQVSRGNDRVDERLDRVEAKLDQLLQIALGTTSNAPAKPSARHRGAAARHANANDAVIRKDERRWKGAEEASEEA